MQRWHSRWMVATAMALMAVGFLGAWGALASAKPEVERHPHIHSALRELREARTELKEADHDFNGHRAEALKAVDFAIEQLEKALKADRK